VEVRTFLRVMKVLVWLTKVVAKESSSPLEAMPRVVRTVVEV